VAQRRLLGDTPASTGIPMPSAQVRRAPTEEEVLLTPPTRITRPVAKGKGDISSSRTPPSLQYTPASKTSPGNLTPDQLQNVLQEFDEKADAGYLQGATAHPSSFAGTMTGHATPSPANYRQVRCGCCKSYFDCNLDKRSKADISVLIIPS
jgi:hypothetical protein